MLQSNQSKRRILLLMSMLLLPVQASAEVFDIEAIAWQQPRSAAMVKSLPPVKSAIARLLERQSATLVIRHRNDEEGTLWGAELRDWLVSLGISPANIRLEIMDLNSAALQLEVTAGDSP